MTAVLYAVPFVPWVAFAALYGVYLRFTRYQPKHRFSPKT